jgi:hypothetical protein
LKMAPNLDSCDSSTPFGVRFSAQTNPGVRRNRVPLAHLLTPLRGAPESAVLQSGCFLPSAAAAQDILDGMVSFLAGILKNAVVRIAG